MTTSVRENLTRDEAERRAAAIGDVATRVHLVLHEDRETFVSDTELRFRVHEPTVTFVDLTAEDVVRIELDGEVLDVTHVEPTRVNLPELDPGEHTLRIEAVMRHQHEGRGLHRFVDPADGAVYLHSQFEPFDAHLVYPCFDQPDIKATFALSVDAPAGWVVVSNTVVTGRPDDGAPGRWTFATTPRLSPYVTAIVAGPYASVHEQYRRADGSEVPLALYVRRSLARHLDHDEIFTITRQGLAFFEESFAQHYPFDKYDQLFVPEFAAGAMENPGCITFSESYVFRSQVTDALRERRAETILHEMAHMWFGDLVTMRWWDDLWLNESFATFMAVLALSRATRWSNAWVTFLDAEKAWAKRQDQLPSTHPVADRMPDVESVHQNFDGITYAKGAAVLRQLVSWVGHDEFLAGCRTYFRRHAWGSTDLDDFLGALEEASGRDLAAWRDEWLLTTGVGELRAGIVVGDDGRYERVTVEQRAPAPSWAELDGDATEVLRRHRLAVGVYDLTGDGLVRRHRVELDVAGRATEVDELRGEAAGAVLLVNDDDLTYAKVHLDDRSLATLTSQLHRFVDPLPRALTWSIAWDMLRDGVLPAGRYLDLVHANVAAEDQVGVLQRLLDRAVAAVERFSHPAVRAQRRRELATAARTAVERAEPGGDLQLAWVRHWASVASADAAQLSDVRRVLDGEHVIEGLRVDTDLRWALLTSLAAADGADEARIATELSRDDTDLGRRHAATARAARPHADAKREAWRLLLEEQLSHTMSRHVWAGFNQIDQVEVLAPYVDTWFGALDDVWEQRSLDWAIEFTEGTFPHHATGPELLGRVDELLAGDELPRPLRRVLLEQRDGLVRSLRAQALDQTDLDQAERDAATSSTSSRSTSAVVS